MIRRTRRPLDIEKTSSAVLLPHAHAGTSDRNVRAITRSLPARAEATEPSPAATVAAITQKQTPAAIRRFLFKRPNSPVPIAADGYTPLRRQPSLVTESADEVQAATALDGTDRRPADQRDRAAGPAFITAEASRAARRDARLARNSGVVLATAGGIDIPSGCADTQSVGQPGTCTTPSQTS